MGLSIRRLATNESWGCGRGKILEVQGNDFLIDDGKGNTYALNQGEYEIEEV